MRILQGMWLFGLGLVLAPITTWQVLVIGLCIGIVGRPIFKDPK